MTFKTKKVSEVNTITSKRSKMSIGFVNRGRMVEIAIANCCPTDKFSRKFGRELVFLNMMDGKTFFLPLGNYEEYQISEILTDMFMENEFF